MSDADPNSRPATPSVDGKRLTGLSAEEVRQSRAEHGSNRLLEVGGKSKWAILRSSFDDRTLKILMLAAGVVLLIDLASDGNYVGRSCLQRLARAGEVQEPANRTGIIAYQGSARRQCRKYLCFRPGGRRRC